MPLSDINITAQNNSCISRMREKSYFVDDKTAAQFAASYALKNLDLSDIPCLGEYKDQSGFTENKWHTSDFDGDRFFRRLIQIYHPNPGDEDYALRAIISLGLNAIDAIISNNKDWTIVDLV